LKLRRPKKRLRRKKPVSVRKKRKKPPVSVLPSAERIRLNGRSSMPVRRS
jgi:hypothetical protein